MSCDIVTLCPIQNKSLQYCLEQWDSKQDKIYHWKSPLSFALKVEHCMVCGMKIEDFLSLARNCDQTLTKSPKDSGWCRLQKNSGQQICSRQISGYSG